MPRSRLMPMLAAIFLLVCGTSGRASAETFDRELRAAYGDYRAVLFHSNTKNAEATFASKWAAIAAKYKAPPARYANDLTWAKTLDAVAVTLNKGSALAQQGKLAEAHEVFEEIRDLIEDLQTRNGVVTFSVRMNAFHHQMEEVLKNKYDGFSPGGLGELREDAALLAYLGMQLRKFPPPEAAGTPEFDDVLRAALDSVSAIQTAARAGDAARAKEALAKLKPAYSRLFLRFG